MLKKIICALMASAVAVLAASCGCAGVSENPTEPSRTVEINSEMQKADSASGQFAHYLVNYKWINADTGDTINFEASTEFDGKINGKIYKGNFTFNVDKKVLGQLNMSVTLDGKKKAVPFTVTFKNSTEITVETDKGEKESYVADWTL